MAYGDHRLWRRVPCAAFLFTLQSPSAAISLPLSWDCSGQARSSRQQGLYRIGDLYTTLVRAIPELLLILMIFYGRSAMNALLIAIGLTDEDRQSRLCGRGRRSRLHLWGIPYRLLRGAIQAIPKGQIEAARAYGMHAPMRFRRIIFPQMIRYAIPGMGNQWLNITKDSSLVSAIGAFEFCSRRERGVRDQGIPVLLFGWRGLLPLLTIVSMVVLQRSNAAPAAACAGHRGAAMTFDHRRPA